MRRTHGNSVKMCAMVFGLFLPEAGASGTRYKDIVFLSATSTTNIQYGSNANLGGSTATLLLDFYEPTDDTLTARPLVIFLHGGSLIVGEKESMSLFCSDFARRGFVAATINYRLGIETPKGTRTILEALLRGVQDTKAAVRFFRANAAAYKIDTTRIYLVGSSAGSMIAVHYAYWDDEEIPPDVNTSLWGDVEGESGNPGFSSAINGIVNYAGAILDPAWIDSGETPVGNFHGLLDEVVPADSGISNDFGIELFGGVAISRTATQRGVYNQGSFFPQMGHGGNEDSLREFSANFLYTLVVLSSSAPQDFTSMDLAGESLSIFLYDTHTFVTTGFDKAGNRIVLPQPMIQYACDARVGTIESTGIFTPSDHPDSGHVYASFNSTLDSCFVRTYDFAYFVIRPRVAVTDTTRPIALRIDTYDADSSKHPLPISMFALASTDPSVGTIDEFGIFTGKKNGSTTIIASFNGYIDTSLVRVESASGLVVFDLLEDLSGWTFEGVNLDSLSVSLSTENKSAGDASFKVGYSFTYNASNPVSMVYLNANRVLYGIPDSMYLDVRSDGRRHRLYYRFIDAESAVFRGTGLKFLNDSTAFANVNASMTAFTPVSGLTQVAYPLTLMRIEIQLAGSTVQGVTTSGAIFVDNLRLKYPGTVTGVSGISMSPSNYALEQNFPNPFNPTTTIRYSLPERVHVSLEVFDMLGRKVTDLVDGEQERGLHEAHFAAGALASGMYVYRLRAGNHVQARKLLVLR